MKNQDRRSVLPDIEDACGNHCVDYRDVSTERTAWGKNATRKAKCSLTASAKIERVHKPNKLTTLRLHLGVIAIRRHRDRIAPWTGSLISGWTQWRNSRREASPLIACCAYTALRNGKLATSVLH